MPKTPSEIQAFMNLQLLASFATIGSGNEPHVVPVFFTYEDGKVCVQTDRRSVKVRNLSRNDDVAITVYSEEEAVIIRGKGRIVENEGEFAKRTQGHIDKYRLRLDGHGRDSLGIPLFNKKIRCVVEVVPKRIIYW